MERQVLLTPGEIMKLRAMCANPFLELGSNMRPEHLKCYNPHVVSTMVKLVIHFPDVETAEKWNLMHQKNIRAIGHIATVALVSAVSLIAGGVAKSIAIGAGTAILKDEVQSNIWYPKVYKNWTLTRLFTFDYQQFPHQFFEMHWTDIIKDENGREHERRNHGVNRFSVGGASGLPESLVHDIMTRFPDTKNVVFK